MRQCGRWILVASKNLPYGLDGTHYRWVDLDGEGLSGILTEQAGSWFYKAEPEPGRTGRPSPASKLHAAAVRTSGARGPRALDGAR